MDDQLHDILLHNDTGDAAFHKGAPLVLEALQIVSDVQRISAATRLGLHLREVEHSRARDQHGVTFTEKHLHQEHAALAEAAAPLLSALVNLLKGCTPVASASAATPSTTRVCSIAALDGLLVPAVLCSTNLKGTDTPQPCSSFAAETFLSPPSLDVANDLAEEMRAHPLFSYNAFLDRLNRLSSLVTNGEVFSACEPRVKVLQSRFSLYRAYNGYREDEHDPVLHGSDIRRAPKCDLRRIETCVSAASVVKFITDLRRDEPNYPLYMVDVAEDTDREGSVNLGAHSHDKQDNVPATASPISIEEAVRRFLGNSAGMSERVLTEEGLCLHPNYAADSADRWLSLQQLADSSDRPSAAHANRLLQHVLSTSGGAKGEGELLARLLQPILKSILSSGTKYDRLELELTVSGESGAELPRLARWCASSGLLESCPGLFFRFHVVQDAYSVATEKTSWPRQHHGQHATPTKCAEDSTTASSGTPPPFFFGDVLHNIFDPIWEAYLAPAASTQGGGGVSNPPPAAERRVAEMQALLQRTTGFSISFTNSAAVQEMPLSGDPSRQFPLPVKQDRNGPAHATGSATSLTPPDAFFTYHIWRNIQLVNAFLLAFGEKQKDAADGADDADTAAATSACFVRPVFTLTLHGGANSRTLFGESTLGLLLADAVVNPTTAFEWSPLTYLFMLARRHVILTPSRNRCCSASVKHTLSATAIPLAVQVGLHVSVATLDPLFYDTTNDALNEELMELTKQRGLANIDVTEMCLRSLEANSGCLTWAERRDLLGYGWPHAQARYNQFPVTQVNSLRLHSRTCALEHELNVLFAAVREASSVGAENPQKLGSRRHEARLRAALFLPPTTKNSSDSSATVYLTNDSASTRALQQEKDLNFLHKLSSYHAHEAFMQYPRILIVGPDIAGPSEEAKRLMAAMNMRETYQQFVTRPGYRSQEQMEKLYASGNEDFTGRSPEAAALVLRWRGGVLSLEEKEPKQPSNHAAHLPGSPLQRLPTWTQFQEDMRLLRSLANADPAAAKYANKRLGMLESKYKLHVALTNDDEESYMIETTSAQAAPSAEASLPTGLRTDLPVKSTPAETAARMAALSRRRVVQQMRGDVHNCIKVDVHCHMASGITAKSLLQFMKQKIRDHPDDVVGLDSKTGAPITLVQFFDEVLGEVKQLESTAAQQICSTTAPQSLAPKHKKEAVAKARADRVARLVAEMPTAALQVHAGKATFHRFDRFNNRFSPMGITSLRSLFLKTDNFMQGRYFAELIRGVFKQNELEGGTFTENRLSIYGRHKDEWDRLSRWFVLHGVSHHTNSWMIQVPRLYHLYRRNGQLHSFQEMLTNIFYPLWEASLHPNKFPYLNFFLSHVSGFDSVDNESDREPDQTINTPPAQWTSEESPPFAYYMFYMWENITTLNCYRASRGLNTFQFRPHAGESGDPDHMADVFVLADGISHGINLDKRPVLQYLYYLAQIPLAIVPMSNNALFRRYQDHPLPQFLYRGLNVALGTDGPLIFHRTEQPLLEEYGTAEALWNLSAADICELAANSVRASGFPVARKKQWLGQLYYLRSVAGNDVARSHVPQTRCAFRYEAYMEEVTYLQKRAACDMSCRAMRTPMEEEVNIMDAIGISREELLVRLWNGDDIPEKQRCFSPPLDSVDGRPARVTKIHEASHI